MAGISKVAMVGTVLLAGLVSQVAPGQSGPKHGKAEKAAAENRTPEKLGTVSFPISCLPAVQEPFNRGVALLHSFTYETARSAFEDVERADPRCGMAHWGVAMTSFHQLWDGAGTPEVQAAAQTEIKAAEALGGTEREKGYIQALAAIYGDPEANPYSARRLKYEEAMKEVAARNPTDVEAQVFYALALLANASPTDTKHVRQKQADDILEPLYVKYPEHPGVAHYIIHACDNAEMAKRGLAAARAYAQIAPSAPHALHMPSHIFTRLGLWGDSVESNLAARVAAQGMKDTGEELHAMDYLVYAYLQEGRDEEALQVIQQLKSMPEMAASDFKMTYAATAMPVRYAVERGQWADAAGTSQPAAGPPQVMAIAHWARGVGQARTGHPAQAREELERLKALAEQLRKAGNAYWATQVEIQGREVEAWATSAEGKGEQAGEEMRAAADLEDGIEKLPVTPGPILPAREQLGEMLLEQKQDAAALQEFKTALTYAPGRRRSLDGVERATQRTASNRVP